MTKKNSKEKILQKAGELFSNSGFSGTSMRDIARSLNITKAALYYHFKNKKELYLKVLDRAFQKLNKNLKKNIEVSSLEQKLFHLIKNYFEWGIEEKNLIKAQMVKFPESDSEIHRKILKFQRKIKNYFGKNLKSALTKEADLNCLISFLLGTMDRMILEAAFWGKKLNIKKKSRQIIKTVIPMMKNIKMPTNKEKVASK